jgi:DnaJ-class molecular chaperone
MKPTRENTVIAEGYTDDNIRECPVCHGSGLTIMAVDGGFPSEVDCPGCEGFGVIIIEEQP